MADSRYQILAFQDKLKKSVEGVAKISKSIEELPTALSKLNIGKKLAASQNVSVADEAASLGIADVSGDIVNSPEFTSLRAREEEKVNSLVFPADLRSAREFILLDFRTYAERHFGLNKEEKSRVQITLPIPSQLNEGFAVAYEEVGLGAFIGGNADEIMKRIPKEGSLTPDQTKNLFKELMMYNLKKDVAVRGAWGLLDALTPGRGVTTALSRATGVIPNPYLVQIFNGMGFREFNFSWKFTPSNEREAATLKEILYQLKTRMLPGLATNKLFFTFPDHCHITLRPKVFDFTRTVLTELAVNHAPSGPAFYRDGGVVEYDVSMRFKEIELVTRNTVKEWNKTPTSIAE